MRVPGDEIDSLPIRLLASFRMNSSEHADPYFLQSALPHSLPSFLSPLNASETVAVASNLATRIPRPALSI
jgi:hypothetical protein